MQLRRLDLGYVVIPSLPGYPDWLDRVLAFDPSRMVFAHNAAVWCP